MVIPKDKSKLGLIIEFKKVNKRRNETLEEAATKALEQIEHKKYSVELKELGIKKILELAIVFDGKKEKLELAKNLMDVLSVEMIAKKTGLSIEEVEKLKESVEEKSSSI